LGLIPGLKLKTYAQKPFQFVAKEVGKPKCQLGEGAFWDSGLGILYFVDIEKGDVLWYTPESKTIEKIACGMRVGTLVPSKPEKGGRARSLVVGLQDGIYKLDPITREKVKIVRPDVLSDAQRLNDGKCDPSGRLWVGSMNLDQKPKQAHLFRIDKDGSAKVMLDSISISNGIVWSADGKKMFYIDTPTRKVMAYDFEFQSGAISNPRVLVQVPDSLGWPDGMAIDENDNLWIGMWGGFCVTSWSGKDGRFLGKVTVPAPNVTSCAFGGKNFDVLYITTARQGLSEEKLAAYPGSGDLFEAKVGVKGTQMPYWLEIAR
jgi:sugar lactone lactonase YvrE